MCMKLEQKIYVQICAYFIYTQLYRKYAHVFT